MTDFSYGNCVYLNDMYETPKSYHKHFIHRIWPDNSIIAHIIIEGSL